MGHSSAHCEGSRGSALQIVNCRALCNDPAACRRNFIAPCAIHQLACCPPTLPDPQAFAILEMPLLFMLLRLLMLVLAFQVSIVCTSDT